DLAGFYDHNAARSAQVAKELETTAFPSLEALLDRVEAVTVVVPTPAHVDVGLPVLERDLHALIEKPLADTLPGAEQLVQVARERRADPHAPRGHRQRPRRVRQRRRGNHHGEPRIARAHAQAAHLSADGLLLARPRPGQRPFLPAEIRMAGIRRDPDRGDRGARAARRARGRAAAARARE